MSSAVPQRVPLQVQTTGFAPLAPKRSHYYTYPNVKLSIFPKGDYTTFKNKYVERRWRAAGRLVADALDTQTGTMDLHIYTIIHLEERVNIGLYSAYRSKLLIGELVDTVHEQELFHRHPASQGLWCANCWKDDLYETSRGGVTISHTLFGGYMAHLHYLDACPCCGSSYKAFDVETRRDDDEAYVFSTVLNEKLQVQVEAFVLSKGILTFSHLRHDDDAFTEAQTEELVAAAMAPARVGPLIRAYGIRAVGAIF